MKRMLTGLAGIVLAYNCFAVDVSDTLLLQMPTQNTTHVGFVYDNSVWLAARDGSNARRMTTARGPEINPRLSPDGKWLAFTANYDGNQDVYVMPVSGGEPRRLTWHPGRDIVNGFSADSSRILFQSSRSVHTRRHRHLYTVTVVGGTPERLPVPNGFKAALSPDGKRIAYSPHGERFGQWKNYRGGTVSRIWILDLDDYDTVEIAQPEGRSNDTDPMWLGEQLYFNSDRNGEFNLFRFDEANNSAEQLTSYDDFPVIDANAGGGQIVFEQAGRLHSYEPVNDSVTDYSIGVGADLREARARWSSNTDWVRNVSMSPGGERVAVSYRGEILNAPGEQGDFQNLSRSTGVHDHSAVWSPDGRQIAWFADAGGEYGLHVRLADGSTEARRFELDGAGFYFSPVWSPDSNKIAYRDNSLTLYVIDLDDGDVTRIDQEAVYSPLLALSHSWSPDSQWLAYTRNTEGLMQTVYVWSANSGDSTQITDGLAEMSEPVFDPEGEQLYVLGSTNAGPMKDWFAQSNLDAQVWTQLYAITLDAGGPNPIPPQNDEVDIEEDDDDSDDDDNEDDAAQVTISFDGLDRRVQPLVTDTYTLRNLRVADSGELYFLETVGNTSFFALSGPGELKRYSTDSRETDVIATDIEAFEISRDSEKIMYLREGKYFIAKLGDKLKGKSFDTSTLRVQADPRMEWQQIFDEAWRMNRDYFYATNFHGADWDAVRAKYEPFVEHAANRADLERIIRWMSSELSVGHSYSGSGDSIDEAQTVSTGLLGADYEVANGRYRFARVYGGLNWSLDLRSPLTAPGVSVTAGEYLLAVNGRELTRQRQPVSVF